MFLSCPAMRHNSSEMMGLYRLYETQNTHGRKEIGEGESPTRTSLVRKE
jgi:hypothetical protein